MVGDLLDKSSNGLVDFVATENCSIHLTALFVIPIFIVNLLVSLRIEHLI